MDLFKLDEYDKYFVAFILVIITLLNIGKCFAVEDVPEGYNLINQNILINNSAIIIDNQTLEERANTSLYYIDISNFSSVLWFNTKAFRYFYSDTLDYSNGDVINEQIITLQSNTDGIFVDTSSVNKHYIIFSYFVDNNVTVYGKDYNGMSDGVHGLVDNVGINQLWGVFDSGIDFVGVIVLVAFGLFLVFLLVKKISKGKADF